jgi:hypothetical protein
MSDRPEQPSPPGFEEVFERIAEDLTLLRSAANRSADSLLQGARGFWGDHPYGALALAFGAGYLVGGGLLSRATWRAFGVGARLAAAGVVRNLVTAIGTAVASNGEAAPTPV